MEDFDSIKPALPTTQSGNDASPSSPPSAGDDAGTCEACTLDRPYVSRIRSPSQIFLALRLIFSDPQRRRDLFTNWIHVPLGITSLLFLTWLIKQAMERAPFRFPSPVLAMVLLFVLLLSLDYLSTRGFVLKRVKAKGEQEEEPQRKVFLQPMLTLLEAPCDFCLRYMSVMFTPSFILIPAREIIGGTEIGYITGWFAASQLLALIFPVLLHKAIRWTVATTKRKYGERKDIELHRAKRVEEQRRASVATLVAVMSSFNPAPTKDEGKILGGEKLGSIATGLSGMTAIATAPLTVNIGQVPGLRRQESQRKDAQRQLTHVQLEVARQQGEPYATAYAAQPEHHHHYPLTPPAAPGSPRSPSLRHVHRLHSDYFEQQQAGRGRRDLGASLDSESRSRSLARSFTRSRAGAAVSVSPTRAIRPRSGGRVGAVIVGPGSGLRNLVRPQSASAASEGSSRFASQQRLGRADKTTVDASLSPTFDEYIFQRRQHMLDRRSRGESESVDPHDLETVEAERGAETLVVPTLAPPTPTRGSQEGRGPQDEIRRPSKADSEMTMSNDVETCPASSDHVESEKVVISENDERGGAEDAEELDAVDRLVEKLWTGIPWLVFTLVLIAGLPLFYLVDISLPLFLGVNLLTFLASITLAPAKIRRYAHPILTTSVATVFILWGLGAARGWSLKRTLSSYSVDAKYTVLWSLSGYNGPVIGAGDVLFSTLDAGIVSLAIPMYRYRWDLWLHLSDMLVVLLPCSMLSLFVWPTVAAQIGIAPERALAFASRFMSTPLAIELSLTIGADESITVVLVVITGILISIFKDPFFRLFGLDPEQDGPEQDKGEGKESHDYLTIGIAMGSTAGAIGASSLIAKPRCMAIASLSFVLFGAILLIFGAIPPVVQTLRTLALAPLEFVPSS